MVDCPVVQTLSGKVKGRACLKAKPKESKQVFRYAGIPYGKPPVGELRFEPPQKCDPWKGVREAIKSAPSPIQDINIAEPLNNFMPVLNEFDEDWKKQLDEDCLYLNVYTSNPDKTANMPVLFWIYGGAFQIGGINGYSAQVLCGLHDVVFVAVNYRLNIFGFFTTGKDTKYPGNMGMLDQVMGLEWTRDNIRNFGGNPDNVTIFGESAGAISVSAHMFSSMSKPLFHKAIHHSGTAVMPGALKEDYSQVLKMFKDEFEIIDSDPDAIARKLKSVSSNDLLEAVNKMFKTFTFFGLTVDGRFLVDHPNNLISKDGALSSIPYIIGCNNTEGSGVMTFQHPPSFFEGYTEEEFEKYFKPYFGIFFDNLGKEKINTLFEKMKTHCSKQFSNEDKLKWTKTSATAQGDFMFLVPAIKQSLASADSGKSNYFYYMTQQLKCHHSDEYAVAVKKKSDFCECDHGDDIVFTFGMPLMNGKKQPECKFSADEEKLSRAWMTYIANFAASGNPNIGKEVEQQWPVYDAKTQRHLNVQIPLREGSHLKQEEYKFWTEAMESI